MDGANSGQVIKEYLQSQSIPAAMKKRDNIIRRAKLRLPGGEITYPTHQTVETQKSELLGKIENKQILIGELITPINFTKFTVDKTTKVINETTITMYGRRISLHDIRTKLLKDHEELGIMRLTDPSEDDNLSDSDIDDALVTRHISFDANESLARKHELLQTAKHCRYLKIWHDHAAIAGRGHFMVLVSCLYDPAFYYTPQELTKKGNNVDVISIVEKPEIHLLAQSGSSDAEKMLYNEPRSESLMDIDIPVLTSTDYPVTDTVRFFHGDLQLVSLKEDIIEVATIHVQHVKQMCTDLTI